MPSENLSYAIYANNRDADQPAHLHSLISVFVIHCIDSMMPIVDISEMWRLLLASVAEQASLSLSWSQITEDRFSHDGAHILLKMRKNIYVNSGVLAKKSLIVKEDLLQ